MYKLIVSDLDETLLNNEHYIPKANLEAIKKAEELGVKFVPATGRGFWGIQSILKELDVIDKKEEYVISFNGGAIVENYNSKILEFNGLPFEKAEELFNFGLGKDVCIHVYTEDNVYMYNLNEDERIRCKNMNMGFEERKEDSIEFLRDTPIAKVIFQNIDHLYLVEISEEMKELTEGVVSVSFSSGRYMEMNRYGVNKGDTMLKLGEMLGVKQEEIIAVGDNYNDMSMLKVAGLSVAAGNAVQGIKDICHYVCENDNNQGVIEEVIRKFIL